MLSTRETMCCTFCGDYSTTVHIDSNGEEMVLLLDAGWCFQLMVIGGPHLKLNIYCPTCSIKEGIIDVRDTIPTLNIQHRIDSNVLHCPKCETVANLHYQGRECTGCDSCCKLEHLPPGRALATDIYVAKCPHCDIVWPVHSKEDPRFLDHPKGHNPKLLCEGSEQEAPQPLYKSEDYPFTQRPN